MSLLNTVAFCAQFFNEPPHKVFPSAPAEDKLDREPSQEISLEAGTIIDMNIDEIPATHLDEQDVQSIIGDLPKQSTIGDETKIIDIDCLTTQFPPNEEIEALVFKGPPPTPKMIPPDNKGQAFPINIFQVRNWLVYSPITKSLYCFPCRILAVTITGHSLLLFASPDGYGQTRSWKKLYNRLPDHEISTSHKTSYLKWR